MKKLPVFYWPYLVWPAKTERTTGLLVPNIGYSRRRGAYLGLAHYQVFGPSYDNTVSRRPVQRRGSTDSATSSATTRAKGRRVAPSVTSSAAR
ncbi:MAG: hypothetical protein R2862_11780 [Thermoanaerobaculia bacterium]